MADLKTSEENLIERLIRNAVLCNDMIGEVKVKLEVTPMGIVVTAIAIDIIAHRTVSIEEISEGNFDPLRLAIDQCSAQVNEALNIRLSAARAH